MLIASLLVPGRGGDYGPEEEKLLSKTIGIQGIVYCKSASKLTPLEGN